MRNTVLKTVNLMKFGEECPAAQVSPGTSLLRGVNFEVFEGDFVSVLCSSRREGDALVEVLSFRKPPDGGEIYFEGRLTGRAGERELEVLRSRVEILDSLLSPEVGDAESSEASVVIVNHREDEGKMDESREIAQWYPDEFPGTLTGVPFLKRIRSLNDRGVPVILVTADPSLASWARTVYKMDRGEMKRICGY